MFPNFDTDGYTSACFSDLKQSCAHVAPIKLKKTSLFLIMFWPYRYIHGFPFMIACNRMNAI